MDSIGHARKITYRLALVSGIDLWCAQDPLLHTVICRHNLSDPGLLHTSDRDGRGALLVIDGDGEGRLDVLFEDVDAVPGGELDSSQRRLLADPERRLQVDAVEDSQSVVGEEGNSKFRKVEGEQSDVVVAENRVLEELTALVRLSALSLSVELDDDRLRGGRNDKAGQTTPLARIRVYWREADAARGGIVVEETVQHLLCQLGLDDFVLDADVGVGVVDESLLDYA